MSKYFKFLGIFLLAILPWLIISKFLLLSDPPIWPDEPVLSDTAINLLERGKIATSIYGGAIKGMAEHAYWYPPLYFYVLAGYIKFFGQNVEILRIFSMILAAIVLFIFALFIKKTLGSWKYVFIGTFMLSIERSFMKASHILRMDILAFLFFLSAILTLKLVQKGSKALYLIPGTLASASAATHPMGLLTVPILTIFVLLSKISAKEKIMGIIYIVLPTIVFVSFWLLSMAGDWDVFIYQFSLQFIRKAHLPSSIIYFSSRDLLWRILFVFYIAVFVVQLLFWLKSKQRLLLGNIVAMVITVVILLWAKEMWYLLYLSPFVIWSILSAKKNIYLLLSVLFVALQFILMRQEYKLNPNLDYNAFGRQIAAYIPKGSSVFIASIPDPYFYLKNENGYQLYEFPTEFIPKSDYLVLLDQTDYIVSNLVPGKLAAVYLTRNRESEKIIPANGNDIRIVKLKPRRERVF